MVVGIISTVACIDNPAPRRELWGSRMTYRLVIGDKRWSSWSLRPWLAMRHAGIAFGEIRIGLRRPDTRSQILRYSPGGHVPVLLVGGERIWESLAILEHLAEAHPSAGLWPGNGQARAHARAIAAEMHAGFAALRRHCPMDLLERAPMASLPDEVAADVRRVVALWADCRRRHAAFGPFLFGGFTAADAMYAPVATRFRTYLPDLSPYAHAGDDAVAGSYMQAIFALPAMAEWERGAEQEAATLSPQALGNLG
jgi:glutathione S-transferase